ncbi:methyltransferase family protein [Motilimonas eburnea]|uniref:methyltransferase family protein n=1 Tax=Motilimonas eburnea TaxID=1737488 RepID=UPI001E416EDF|nr:isoprenylcysteine carboxylmethyltransferase family protein [Motilimonas eburnea]MCE2573820.1 isoprenylcysteine carboxylmethyltransferase family protein [Motilimonas eburnea]
MSLSLKVLPVGVLVVAMVLAKLIAIWLPGVSLPAQWIYPAVSLFILLGLIFGLSGVGLFRRFNTTVNPINPEQASTLVTSGIYRFSRNPMYLGLLFCLLAWASYLGALTAFLVAPLFVIYMNLFQIIPEEQVLTRLFGESYQAYCRRVRRWL